MCPAGVMRGGGAGCTGAVLPTWSRAVAGAGDVWCSAGLCWTGLGRGFYDAGFSEEGSGALLVVSWSAVVLFSSWPQGLYV